MTHDNIISKINTFYFNMILLFMFDLDTFIESLFIVIAFNKPHYFFTTYKN